MKQTAVEWLVEQICGDHTSEWQKQINQAKQMEKDNTKKLLEIIMWYDEQSDVRPNTEIYTWFEQYYNETFNAKEK